MPNSLDLINQKDLKKQLSIFNRIFPTLYDVFFVFFFSILFSVKALAADVAAPDTVASKSPPSPNGNNGWYKTPVAVTLSSTDLDSGVKEINYKIDSGNWIKRDFSDTLNLAPNPSFELSGETAPLFTRDWVVGAQDEFVNYSNDSAVYKPNFATTSVQIASTGGSWHSINHLASFARATPYDNMNAYAWVKTENAAGTAYFNIYAVSQDADGNISTSLIDSSSTLTGINDWTQLSLNFVVNVENAIGVYMEIGLNGSGTIWVDAVNINNSSFNQTTTFTVATDGEHTIQYYAVDKVGNIELTKSLSFKIDQTPPSNWRDSGAVRSTSGGSEHEVYVWTHVDDPTSGLSTLTDKFQYTTDRNEGFGHFSELLACNSTWQPDGWASLVSSAVEGAHTAYLVTPKVDFCDSNWKICKYTRFYSEDMAGNVAIKDMCINGPWIMVRGKGIVRANQNIDMVSEGYEPNTDGLVEAGGSSINFFSSSVASTGLYMTNSTTPPEYNYDKLFELAPNSKTQISTSGNLVASSGVYEIKGDYEITSGKVPANYSSASFNQIVFVDGKLRISNAVQVSDASTALFIVKGKVENDVKKGVEIAKGVQNVRIGIITDGDFNTAYNISEGEECKALVLKGVYTAEKFILQRTLQGTQNEKNPSEDITYEPKYLIRLGNYIGINSVRWISSD